MNTATRTPMTSDALLNALADEYQLLGLSRYGVSFWQFLLEPRRGRELLGEGFRPLLPSQQAVQDALDQELEEAVEAAERDLLRERPDTRCRGGTFTEPLHHHAHGHDRRKSYFRPGGKS